jgi:hypothetical protein
LENNLIPPLWEESQINYCTDTRRDKNAQFNISLTQNASLLITAGQKIYTQGRWRKRRVCHARLCPHWRGCPLFVCVLPPPSFVMNTGRHFHQTQNFAGEHYYFWSTSAAAVYKFDDRSAAARCVHPGRHINKFTHLPGWSSQFINRLFANAFWCTALMIRAPFLSWIITLFARNNGEHRIGENEAAS